MAWWSKKKKSEETVTAAEAAGPLAVNVPEAGVGTKANVLDSDIAGAVGLGVNAASGADVATAETAVPDAVSAGALDLGTLAFDVAGSDAPDVNVIDPDLDEIVSDTIDTADVEVPVPAKPEKKGFFARLRDGLAKTRGNIVAGIDAVFKGFGSIDDDFYEELEEILIMGDIGVNATS